MITLDDYRDRFDNIAMSRGDDGVLEVRVHSDGGPLAWSAAVHRDLGDAFTHMAMDRDNKVVLVTGTGDAFCDRIDYETFGDLRWEMMWSEGKRLLQALVDIEVPVIGVVNGPATIHAELVVTADIVIAADTAVLADHAHFVGGAVPSDGVHLVWPHLLGPNRGRHFLLTGRELSATEAYELGIVAEVVPAADAHDRGRAIARSLATKPSRMLRYTREALVAPWRELLHGPGLSNGLALEGIGSDLPR
jgi:enoyl-CoA hydratase/carnithine racemase